MHISKFCQCNWAIILQQAWSMCLKDKVRQFGDDNRPAKNVTRKPYGFMQSSFWVIMMVHVMVCGDL